MLLQIIVCKRRSSLNANSISSQGNHSMQPMAMFYFKIYSHLHVLAMYTNYSPTSMLVIVLCKCKVLPSLSGLQVKLGLE